MSEKQSIISLHHMSCQIGQRYLLHNINWEVCKGENWVVFGANGCGKTTLLSIIAGFRSHTEGEVHIFGEPFERGRILQQRCRIGWASGSFFENRYGKEAVLDIVLSGVTGTLSPNGLVHDRDVVRAKVLLEKLQVESKLYETFDTLSKGEREKVLLARAMVNEPELLLLDEPGTGLDLAAREKLLEMINELALEKKMTVIHVTHHVEEITSAFCHCLLLKNGRIYRQGTIQEIFQSKVLSDFLNVSVDLHQYNGRIFAHKGMA